MKRTLFSIFSIGLAIIGAASASATDLYQFDDVLQTNCVVAPSTNSMLGASGVSGQTNLVSSTFNQGQYSLTGAGGRYGAFPVYNPYEQGYKVYGIYGYWTSQTNGNAALTNGILTTLPAGGGTVIMDIAPVSTLGMWGGANQVEGPTNGSIVFTLLQTTNPQVAYAYVPCTNYQNIKLEGPVDFRCTATNNFFIQRAWTEGWVMKSP